MNRIAAEPALVTKRSSRGSRQVLYGMIIFYAALLMPVVFGGGRAAESSAKIVFFKDFIDRFEQVLSGLVETMEPVQDIAVWFFSGIVMILLLGLIDNRLTPFRPPR